MVEPNLIYNIYYNNYIQLHYVTILKFYRYDQSWFQFTFIYSNSIQCNDKKDQFKFNSIHFYSIQIQFANWQHWHLIGMYLYESRSNDQNSDENKYNHSGPWSQLAMVAYTVGTAHVSKKHFEHGSLVTKNNWFSA